MTSPRFLVITAAILTGGVTAAGRQSPASPPAQPPATAPAAARPERPQIQMDPDRARQLYVSRDPKDHGLGVDFARQIQAKAETDRRYAEAAKGLVDFKKVTCRSSVGDMDIPAYLFQPVQKRGASGQAAMVWVHGGVHGDWSATMWPFVKEAVDRGYEAALNGATHAEFFTGGPGDQQKSLFL